MRAEYMDRMAVSIPSAAERTAKARGSTRRGLHLLQAETWMADGACVNEGADPDLFFPGRGESNEDAVSICKRCPVRDLCLEYALEHGEHHGIWGGTSERERRRIRRARRAS